MKNYEAYTEEYTFTYSKIDIYRCDRKNEMYDNWSNDDEWDSVEVMEEFIGHHSYSLEAIFGL